ncbi:MAG: AraC family transcriptional regulator [Bacteroidia bacterium]|nr:AraC family transcriptional regulator [Bacteroidia bacterium]
MSSQTMLYTSKREVRQATDAGKSSYFSNFKPTKKEISLRGYLVRYLFEGNEKFKIDGRTHYLLPGEYLILNPGEMVFTVEEQSKGLWFEIPKTLLKRELSQLSVDSAEAWQGFYKKDKKHIHLCDHNYLASMDDLGKLLKQIAEGEVAEDNALRLVCLQLLNSQRTVYMKIARLTSAKLSTRTELYRRLCQTQAYIHGNLNSPLDLDTLSQVACLSKYHFIRLFKEVYGETPRQYLIKQRLDRAKNLLVSSKKTFHEICHEVGLKDSSSFGRLFKRSFGATPQIYRQKNAHIMR